MPSPAIDLRTCARLELPATADMHVHLRQDGLMRLVVPLLARGGVDTAFVMPNLVPPLTSIHQALAYQAQLKAIAPNVHFLMSLFLDACITPDVIAQASAAGITGVKMYPQGVTTNSESGVSDLASFYPTFAAMEQHDMVLNLHGEVLESLAPADATLEEAFLPTLATLHERFPRLRIVLEHCTTAAAVEAVRACGPTVGATITAHHLYLTGDQACDPLAFCKPIPKRPADRDALARVVVSGDAKFFFGSDSAPHLLQSKLSAAQGKGKTPAGVFTQPYATQLVLLGLEEAQSRGVIADADVTQESLEGFLSGFGRRFYKLPEVPARRIVLEKRGERIATSMRSDNGEIEVGVSRPGIEVFSLTWK